MGITSSFPINIQTENCIGMNNNNSIDIIENILAESKIKQIILYSYMGTDNFYMFNIKDKNINISLFVDENNIHICYGCNINNCNCKKIGIGTAYIDIIKIRQSNNIIHAKLLNVEHRNLKFIYKNIYYSISSLDNGEFILN